MDVSQIDDLQTLKALAYDQMVLQEQIQRNLTLITARIAEMEARVPANVGTKNEENPPRKRLG